MVECISGTILDWHYDTTYYSDKISIATAYNKVTIKYLEDEKITMELDESGGLNKEYENPHKFAYGQFFENGYVEIKLGNMALGGGYSYTITGTKKERSEK
jgi:hypothetical protein